MGAQLSVQRAAAQKHAEQGWPAFLNTETVQMQMTKFRVRKSLLGRRLRFFDRTGGCIEYARLSISRGGMTFYQRVDGPCSKSTAVPKFPYALVPHELDRRAGLPYKVTVLRENYAELGEPGSLRRCASYRRSNSGVWIKVEEKCRETAHDDEVKKQLAKLGRTGSGTTAQRRQYSLPSAVSGSRQADDVLFSGGRSGGASYFSPGTGRRISGGGRSGGVSASRSASREYSSSLR